VRPSSPTPILMGMKEQLVPDALWERMAPLLPRRRAHRKGGRPWADDRAALRGVLFVLKTGIAWRDLPAEVFGVSGVTCWRRLEQWTRAGVFQRLQEQLLDELGAKGRIDWSRASLDSGSVRAKRGGPKRAQTLLTEGKRAASTMS
jgi:transposase